MSIQDSSAVQTPARGRRLSFLCYMGLSVLALYGVVYNSALLARRPEVRGLVILGEASPAFLRVDPTKPLKHIFTLHNPTSRPVRIQKVRTGCTCTTTKISDQVVGPGESLPLEVTIQTFKAFVTRFAEPTFVETDDGHIELWMSGALDIPPSVLFYPQALYLEVDSDGRLPERIVRMKVPAACVKRREEWALELTGAVRGETELVEDVPSSQFRELAVRLTCRLPADGQKAKGALRIDIGCSAFEIPITIAP